jgi:hypothetical protein
LRFFVAKIILNVSIKLVDYFRFLKSQVVGLKSFLYLYGTEKHVFE